MKQENNNDKIIPSCVCLCLGIRLNMLREPVVIVTKLVY